MIGTVLFFFALKELPVSIVSIYENGLYTVLTVLLAVWVLKEKLPKWTPIYLSLCIIGLALIVTKGEMKIPELSLIGIIFLSVNALLSSVNTTIEMFNLKKISIFTITFFKSIMSAILMLIMVFVSKQSITDMFLLMNLWVGFFVFYSIISSFAIKYLHLKSMKVLNSSKTAIFQLITPIFSILFALIIFNETIILVQWVGIALIIFSVYKLK
jgi:drug/metabolite transporter (DMT)-like permease